MGSRLGTADSAPNERPVHQVCFKQGFYMSQYEITQKQYKMVMNANPSDSGHGIGDEYPVAKVKMSDAIAFAKELTVNTGSSFVLPSEAQWEYACRAGRDDTYCGGNDIESIAWYEGNADSKLHRVGGKRANAWGLHDMSGNVWEWVTDSWHENYQGAPTDGKSWDDGGSLTNGLLRGGSIEKKEKVRAGYRYSQKADDTGWGVGIRLVRMLP